MFNSPIIDIAIALSFTYFTLSLVVSTVQEYLSSLKNNRGKFLKEAIQCLFFDEHWDKLAKKIYASENIKALKNKKPEQLPSYIPASSFAQALIEQFKGGDFSIIDMDQIREGLLSSERAVATGVEGAARKVLLNFYERANGDLLNFQKQIESFYNDAMDRAAGAYKRHSQVWVFVISFVIATALNADTIKIVSTMWADPVALKQSADNIQAVVKEIKKQTGDDFTGKKIAIDSTGKKLTVVSIKDSAAKADSVQHLNDMIRSVSNAGSYLKNSGIPIGWHGFKLSIIDHFWGSLLTLIIKLGGLLLTASALMLGAPFWFDLINKVVNIRGTGKKPEENTSPKP